MALNEHLEALVGSLKSAEQQQQLRAILEAEPAVGEGWLRQSDYSRRQDELRRQREEYEASMAAERAAVASWKTFHDQEVAREEQYQREISARNQAIAAKEAEMAELRRQQQAARGADPDADPNPSESVVEAVNRALAARGYVGQAEVDQRVNSAVTAASAEFRKLYDQQRAADMAFTGAVYDQCRRYEREFNRPLASADLVKFMAEKGLNDPAVALDQYAAKDRETALIERLRNEVREEEKAKLSAQRLPGAGATPDAELSARDRLTLGKVATPLPQGAKFGTGRLAEAIAARRAAEGKPPVWTGAQQ